MSLPPPSTGPMPPHSAPCTQPPLPPQHPGLPSFDMSQSNPQDTHLNNPHHPEPSYNIDPFPVTASNVPHISVQNVNPPSHPFRLNGQLPWDVIWPLVFPPLQDGSCQQSSTTQNAQATSACPNCTTHPTSVPVQLGGGQAAPAVQAPSAAASSSSSCPNPTAPHTAPPVPEAPLFRPGVAGAGPTTANAYARKSRRVPPFRNPRRRAREVPLVRIEDRIEWVSRDVMKMTLWFNWSPDAEAEAHEEWA